MNIHNLLLWRGNLIETPGTTTH